MCRLGGSSGSNVEKAACNWFQQHHITTASDHNRIRSQRHQITIPEPLAIGFNGIGPQRHQTTTASDHNGISSQIPERVPYHRLPPHLISLACSSASPLSRAHPNQRTHLMFCAHPPLSICSKPKQSVLESKSHVLHRQERTASRPIRSDSAPSRTTPRNRLPKRLRRHGTKRG